MGIRIVGNEPEAQAALYDSVTGTAFGPVFESAFEAEEFSTHWYTSGPDLRTLAPDEVAALVAQYRAERDAEEEQVV